MNYKIVNDLVYDLEGNLVVRARYDENSDKIFDIADLDLDKFYIDENGIKHIRKYDENWQELKCKWDDELVFDENQGKWRIKTEEERLREKRNKYKKEFVDLTNDFLLSVLSKYDWGETYEECIAELNQSTFSVLTELLYYIRKRDNTITTDDIRIQIIEFWLNNRTVREIKNNLEEKGFDENEIRNIMELYKRGIEVLKFQYFVDRAWNLEESIESKLEHVVNDEDFEDLKKYLVESLEKIKDLVDTDSAF